jgi:hypothetical protein
MLLPHQVAGIECCCPRHRFLLPDCFDNASELEWWRANQSYLRIWSFLLGRLGRIARLGSSMRKAGCFPSFEQENFPGPVSAKNSDKKYLKNMG